MTPVGQLSTRYSDVAKGRERIVLGSLKTAFR
jgi:hypothetical protein